MTVSTAATVTGPTLAFTEAMLTCDTTKWASATACDGVTRWGMGTMTDYTSATAKGGFDAWMWLADRNPTSAASVFGVEKDDVINIIVYQHSQGTHTGVAALETASAIGATLCSNKYGVATFTHAGASATMLGASAVMAALLSFF